MGHNEDYYYYTIDSVKKKGVFHVCMEVESEIFKSISSMSKGTPMMVCGPFGETKYIGKGDFVK